MLIKYLGILIVLDPFLRVLLNGEAPLKIRVLKKKIRFRLLQEEVAQNGNLTLSSKNMMKKDAPFLWDQSCQNSFESIKRFLINAPLLGAATLGKPLILYIASQ